MTTSPATAIVVGVDGSPQSLHALDWATREATARQCPLRIMHAFLWPLYNVQLGPPDAGLQAQLANPVNTPYADWAHGLGRDFTYAAGVALATDGTLVHTSSTEGFKTAFEIRPDRRTAIAVTCNSTDTGSTTMERRRPDRTGPGRRG